VPAIVEINDRMCDAIARVLEQYSIPADIEDTSIEGMNAARISIYGKKYWEMSPSLIYHDMGTMLMRKPGNQYY